MKKFTSVLLVLAMLFSVCSVGSVTSFATTQSEVASATLDEVELIEASAASFEYSVLSDGTAEITDYVGESTDVVIPSVIDGYTVTVIGSNSFYGCSSLTSVVIPDTVTSIGWYAFEKCSSLTSIIIPESVVSVKDDAFYRCSNLSAVYYGGTAESWSQIDFSTFLSSPFYHSGNLYIDNELLTDVVITSVTQIKSYAFYNCTSITSVTLPDTITSIGSSAFNGCSSLKSINIPDGVTTIDRYTFSGCRSLESVEIPDSVQNILEGAFFDCSSLESIKIPDGITEIDRQVFLDCDSLTSVTLPDSLTYIGGYAFSGCEKLKRIVIPDTVTSLAEYAFNACWWLKDIKLPENLVSIERYAFCDCRSLENITLPDSVAEIEWNAFQNCASLKSINIPYGISEIESSAFSGCSSLTSVTLPKSVTYIDDRAFYNCVSLESITIPDYVTYIGRYAFYNCDLLTDVIVPDGVYQIEDYAFKSCDSLINIKVPDSVEFLGDGIFDECSSSMTIYGYFDSAIYSYSQEYGLNFVSLIGESISATITNKTISLKWTEYENAVKYWVYVNGVCYGSSITNEYVIKNRKANTLYNIQLVALLNDKTKLSLDDSYSAEVVTRKNIVTDVEVQAGITWATLSWGSLDGASKYWIYISDDYGTSYRLCASTTDTYCTINRLTPSHYYYFKVVALVDGKITDLEAIDYSSVWISDSSVMVNGITESSISVYWNGIDSADKYWVMVSSTTDDTSDTSQWKIVSSTGTSCTVSGLESCVEYNICVRARYEENGVYKTCDYTQTSRSTNSG